MFYAELAELRGTFFILRQNTTRALASLARAEHHGTNSSQYRINSARLRQRERSKRPRSALASNLNINKKSSA